MANLVKRSKRGGGLVPAVASAIIPGLGQLFNGDSDKAIGVFTVSVVAGLGFWGGIPLIGGVAGVVALGTWLYGIGNGFSGRRD